MLAGAASTTIRSAISTASSIRCVIKRQVFLQLLDQLHEVLTQDLRRGVIQLAKTFVEQHQLRLDGHCARQRHPLPHAARQLMWKLGVMNFAELDPLQPVARARDRSAFDTPRYSRPN